MSIINNKEIIVLVDAWSGGKNLIPAFQSLGYYCLHIQSLFLAEIFYADNQLAISRSDKHIIFDGNLEKLVNNLKDFNIKAVLAGSESGVALADYLNHVLNLPFSNQFKLSEARRNKFLMQERLGDCGVASIKQLLISRKDRLRHWLTKHGQWPVVLKPVQSAGTDHVFICHNITQCFEAFDSILLSKDIFGQPNEAVLCQAFLLGEEFVVNGVACEGKYFFTELWQSTKQYRKDVPIYETQYLLHEESAKFSSLTVYTTQVCQALGIENGAFHAEVMMTIDGPVLIEIGARVAGGADPYVIEECLGHSQIGKLLQAVLQPKLFHHDMLFRRDLSSRQCAAYVYLISPFKGQLRRSPEAFFISIEGVISVNYHYKAGDIQQETKDLISSPGLVIVIRANIYLLNKTIAKIRKLEKEFFQKNLVAYQGE